MGCKGSRVRISALRPLDPLTRAALFAHRQRMPASTCAWVEPSRAGWPPRSNTTCTSASPARQRCGNSRWKQRAKHGQEPGRTRLPRPSRSSHRAEDVRQAERARVPDADLVFLVTRGRSVLDRLRGSAARHGSYGHAAHGFRLDCAP